MVRFLSVWGLVLSVSMSSLSTWAATSTAKDKKPQRTVALAPGWNLVVAPLDASTLPPKWQDAHIRVWHAKSFAERTAPSPTPSEAATALVAGEVYWVHAREPQTLEWDSQDDRSFGPVGPGWDLFGVSTDAAHGDIMASRILAWDTARQRYTPVRVGETVVPGQGYWGLFTEETTPFARTCLPPDWSFVSAAQVIATCPFSTAADHIVPREEWSTRHPAAASTSARSSRIVLHHSQTEREMRVQALQERNGPNGQAALLDAHFIVALDEQNAWQTYEGRPLATPSGENRLPPQIDVIIVGTYEAIQSALYAETQFGFEPGASEADQQPPMEAVLRLSALVAHLSSHHQGIKDIVPYAQGPHAAYPGKGLSPGRGTLHLIEALRLRFFGRAPTLPDPRLSFTPPLPFQELKEDLDAPTLTVHTPQASTRYIRSPWLRLGGEVFDEALEGLYLNGALVTDKSSSFSERVRLRPGNNRLDLVAVDQSGNAKRVELNVIHDAQAPAIEVTTVAPSGAPNKAVEFQVQVHEPRLQELRLNGRILPWAHEFSQRVALDDLSPGVSHFDFEARDQAGHISQIRVSVEKDETGQVLVRAPSEKNAVEPQATNVAPLFTLEASTDSPVYTHQDRFVVSGQLIDASIRLVSINGMLVPTRDGAFQQTLRLFSDTTEVEVLAENVLGEQFVERTTIVRDQKPPQIHMRGQSEQDVYQAQHVVTGRVLDAHLKQLTLVQKKGLLEQTVDVVEGTFHATVELDKGPNHFVLSALDHAHNKTTVPLVLSLQPGLKKAVPPRAPSGFSATTYAQEVTLAWQPPALFVGGHEIPAGIEVSHRVYRDNVLLQEVGASKQYLDKVPTNNRIYTYTVSAVVRDQNGAAFESARSEAIPVEVTAPQAATKPGAFEPGHILATPDGQAALPSVALSKFEGTLFAHVVHVTRGRDEQAPDTLAYARSHKAGKPGTFETTAELTRGTPGWMVAEVVVAARGPRVGIAWIEAPKQPPEEHPTSRLWVTESQDRGQSFSSPRLVRETASWKRGLGMDYDHETNLHLVWGEGGKVYYLKNLEGDVSNVFDVQKRDPSNTVAQQAGEDATQDPYRYRIEENQVHQPSLHIDAQTISIVGRRTRMWDNTPGGTWHEQDKILIAQRPLVEGAWAQSENEDGWQQGRWQGNTLTDWRISSAGPLDEGQGDGLPSHPQAASSPFGLALVYEDGPSDNPNQLGSNPIKLQTSTDGGVTWSTPHTLGLGYLPQVGVTDEGQLTVLYYVPRADGGGLIEARTRIEAGQSFGPQVSINKLPVRPIHWKNHGGKSDSFRGRVAMASHEDLFFAAWIEKTPADADQVVTARASYAPEVTQYAVELPPFLTQGKSTRLKVTAENRYHMQVDAKDSLRLVTRKGSRSGQSGGPAAAPASTSKADVPPPGGSLEVQLTSGQALVWTDHQNLSLWSKLGTVNLAEHEAIEPPDATLQTALLPSEPTMSAFGDTIPSFEPTADGNYRKAQWMRDRLFALDEHDWAGRSVAYQVEYEATENDPTSRAKKGDVDRAESGRDTDSQYLASFERVWAYTQGIALAQFSRSGTPTDNRRAQALARYLCDQGQHAPPSEGDWVIKGWHFSWNTSGDDWKDARLVTGASAWVVHGLGVFLTSGAFASIPFEADKVILQGCYHAALRGLELHRVSGTTQDGKPISLMTAGFTTRGLDQAATPWNIEGPGGERLALKREVWDYYDVLDAIGYEDFDPERPPEVARRFEDSAPGQGTLNDGAPKVLAEGELKILKEQVRAMNVVTEHNLDVLSVLNHALDHAGPLEVDTAHLETWRNEVRNGIFYVLWDDEGTLWRRDLEGALRSAAPGGQKQEQIEAALERGDWGRVSTGGMMVTPSDVRAVAQGQRISRDDFVHKLQSGSDHGATEIQGPDGRVHFVRSKHVAVDNCSWLSLSVDYADLGAKEEIDRLGRCLEFTTLAFAKHIEFEGKAYYGSHYFFDEFEDRYIAASARQEQSFHLEATTGLILALFEFAQNHPEHEKAAFFDSEARALWAGVQSFVVDHGFPYSSQRIQDLSTLLTSSTALIWFIDTYDHINQQGLDLQRPLKNYASHVRPGIVEHFVGTAFERLKALTSTTTHLVRSGGPRVIRFTRVDEQAMAVVTAVNQNDWGMADLWVQALLKTRRETTISDDSGTRTHQEFPAVVETNSGNPLFAFRHTGVQMTAYYALGWYLEARRQDPHAPQDLTLERDVEETLTKGLSSMISLYWKPLDPELDDLTDLHDLFLWGGPSEDAVAPRARTRDNALAYLAYKQAKRALGDDTHLSAYLLTGWLEGLETMVGAHCSQGVISEGIGLLHQKAPSFAVSAGANYANQGPCMLFLAATQNFASLQDRLDKVIPRKQRIDFLEREHGGAPTWPLETHSLPEPQMPPFGKDAWQKYADAEHATEPLLWARLVQEGLGRRGLAKIDPRQKELALEELEWLRKLRGDSAFYHIATLLLYNPGGAFGLEDAPLFRVPDQEHTRADFDHQVRSVEKDVVRTLFLSTPTPEHFDPLLNQIAALRFALQQNENGVVPSEWPSTFHRQRHEWIARADRHLLNLCGTDAGYFNIPCETLSALYLGLRTERFRTTDSGIGALVTEPGPFLWHEILEALYTPHGDKHVIRFVDEPGDPDTPVCVTCIHPLPVVTLTEDASVADQQRELQQAVLAAYDRKLADYAKFAPTRSKSPAIYGLVGTDAIDALNPSAATYWSPRSMTLRSVLQYQAHTGVTARNKLVFEPKPPFDVLGLPLSKNAATKIRALRERINRHWNGDLTAAAKAADLLPGALHRAMQTGALSQPHLDALTFWEAGGPSRYGGERPLQIIGESLVEGQFDPQKGWSDARFVIGVHANTCRRFFAINTGREPLDVSFEAEFESAPHISDGAVVSVKHPELGLLDPDEKGYFDVCLDAPQAFIDEIVPIHGPRVYAGWIIKARYGSQESSSFYVDLLADEESDQWVNIAGVSERDTLELKPNSCRRYEIYNNHRHLMDWQVRADKTFQDTGFVAVVDDVQKPILERHESGSFRVCLEASVDDIVRVRGPRQHLFPVGWSVRLRLEGDDRQYAFPIEMTGNDTKQDALRDMEIVGAYDGRIRVPYNGCKDFEVINRKQEAMDLRFEVTPLDGESPPTSGLVTVEPTEFQTIPSGGRGQLTACAIGPADRYRVGGAPPTGWRIEAISKPEDEGAFRYPVDALVHGVAGYWPLDGNGTERSYGAYPTEATPFGRPAAWISGWAGQALEGGGALDARTGYGEYHESYAFLETSEAFSASFWIARPERQSEEALHVIGNRGPGNIDAGWSITLTPDDHIAFDVVPERGGSFSARSADPIRWPGSPVSTPKGWTHIVVTYNGDNEAKLFVGGQPLRMIPSSRLDGAAKPLPNTYPVRIGWSSYGLDRASPGGLDEVRLVRGVLDVNDIQTLRDPLLSTSRSHAAASDVGRYPMPVTLATASETPCADAPCDAGTPGKTTPDIPEWFKNNADWWAQGTIDDNEFVTGVEYLIQEGIIQVAETQAASGQEPLPIPDYVRRNAGLWVEGALSDKEFLDTIAYLIGIGVITVQPPADRTPTQDPRLKITGPEPLEFRFSPSGEFSPDNHVLTVISENMKPTDWEIVIEGNESWLEARKQSPTEGSGPPTSEQVRITINPLAALEAMLDHNTDKLTATLAFKCHHASDTGFPCAPSEEVNIVGGAVEQSRFRQGVVANGFEQMVEHIATNQLVAQGLTRAYARLPAQLGTTGLLMEATEAQRLLGELYRQIADAELAIGAAQPFIDLVRSDALDVSPSRTNELLSQLLKSQAEVRAGTEDLERIKNELNVKGTLVDDDDPAGNTFAAWFTYAIKPEIRTFEAAIDDAKSIQDEVGSLPGKLRAQGCGALASDASALIQQHQESLEMMEVGVDALHILEEEFGKGGIGESLIDTEFLRDFQTRIEDAYVLLATADILGDALQDLNAPGVCSESNSLGFLPGFQGVFMPDAASSHPPFQTLAATAEVAASSIAPIDVELTQGDATEVSPSDPDIPVWIKNNAGWWAQEQITDGEFLAGMGYLVQQGVIHVKESNTPTTKDPSTIPQYIRNNAGLWANGTLSDGEFLAGIEYLIGAGVLVVPVPNQGGAPELEVTLSEPLEFVFSPSGQLAPDKHFLTVRSMDYESGDWEIIVDGGGDWLQEPERSDSGASGVKTSEHVRIRVNALAALQAMLDGNTEELSARLTFKCQWEGQKKGCATNQEVKVVSIVPLHTEFLQESLANALEQIYDDMLTNQGLARGLLNTYAMLPAYLAASGLVHETREAQDLFNELYEDNAEIELVAELVPPSISLLRSGAFDLSSGMDYFFQEFAASQSEIRALRIGIEQTSDRLYELEGMADTSNPDGNTYVAWFTHVLLPQFDRFEEAIEEAEAIQNEVAALPDRLKALGCRNLALESQAMIWDHEAIKNVLAKGVGDMRAAEADIKRVESPDEPIDPGRVRDFQPLSEAVFMTVVTLELMGQVLRDMNRTDQCAFDTSPQLPRFDQILMKNARPGQSPFRPLAAAAERAASSIAHMDVELVRGDEGRANRSTAQGQGDGAETEPTRGVPEMLFDFDDPADDLVWDHQPRDSELRYENPFGSRALVYEYEHLSDGTQEYWQTEDRYYQRLTSELPAISTDFAYLSVDVITARKTEAGARLSGHTFAYGTGEWGPFADVTLTHLCTRLVFPVSNPDWTQQTFVDFWIYAPKGYRPYRGFHGVFMFDNIVGYPEGVPPPPSGESCVPPNPPGIRSSPAPSD